MPQLITYITGKELMERWNKDGYYIFQVMKNEGLEISGGTFDDEVKVARLLIADKVPYDIDDTIASFQFALSKIENIEKIFNLLPEKQTDSYPKEDPGIDNKLEVDDASTNKVSEPLKKEPKQDPESFVNNLRISCENDNEIKIQESGKMAKCITCQSLGFRNNKAKAWKTFIEILQNPPHTYYIGPAYKYHKVYRPSDKFEDEETKPKYSKKGSRNPEYDRRLKRLSEINKKLVAYLNDHYPTQIPSNFKIYERCQEEKKGTYKFKFKITSGEKESNKDHVLNEFERLTKKDRETSNDSLMGRINELVATILENKWLTKDEITNTFLTYQTNDHGSGNGCSRTKKLPSAE